MSLVETLGLALALGADPFALGLCVGAHCFMLRQVLRMGLSLGFSHFVMSIAGWLLGNQVAGILSFLGPWVAFVVIGFFGVKLIKDSIRSSQLPMSSLPVGKGWLFICFVASLDAFGVGFGLGINGANMWLSAVLIGLVTTFSAIISMPLSCRISMLVGSRLGVVCGVLMVFLAFRMLLG